MLQIPEKDFPRSVNQINVSVTSLGDWLEACLLFSREQLSKSDVVDLLLEEQVCDDSGQDMAYQIATLGWEELSRRQRWGGLSADIKFTRDRLTLTSKWEDDLFSSFMVLLSIFRIYPKWAADYRDYVGQGDLFERCTELICPSLLPGWQTYRAGWTPDDAKNIPGIVEALCELLFTKGAADLDQWIAPQANDGGLYQVPKRLTHVGDSQAADFLIHHLRLKETCDGGCDWGSNRLRFGRFAWFGALLW